MDRWYRIVGPLLSPYEKHKRLSLKYLGPVIRERLRMKEEHGSGWEGKPVRTLSGVGVIGWELIAF